VVSQFADTGAKLSPDNTWEGKNTLPTFSILANQAGKTVL